MQGDSWNVVGTFHLKEMALQFNLLTEVVVQNRTDFIGSYYGGQVKIDLYKSENTYIANRFSLGNVAPVAASIQNLTSIVPQNGSIRFLPTENFWFVPFDITLSAGPADPGGDNFDCVVDGKCEGECTTETQANGCLRCYCTLNGDCDFKNASVRGGGIVLEATMVTVNNF
jgi:hypothetical protein